MKTRKEQSNIEYDGGTEDTSTLKKQDHPFEHGPEPFDKRQDGRPEIGTMLDVSSGFFRECAVLWVCSK